MIKEFGKELYQPVAIDKIDEFQKQYYYKDTYLKNIELNEEDLSVTIDGSEYVFTGTSFKIFCKVLGIPHPFVNRIPVDLFKVNVDRLKNEFNVAISIAYRGNVIVNVFPYKKDNFFKHLKTSEILDYYSSDSYDIKSINMGDFGATVDVIHEDLSTFEVKKGEIVGVGYRITNPYTMIGNKLQGSLYLNQVVCSNGMVMPREFLGSSVNLLKRFESDADYCDALKNNIDGQIDEKYELDHLVNLFTDMSECYIQYRFLKSIVGKVGRIDESFVKNVFDIDLSNDEDKEFYKKKFKEETEDSDFKYFEAIYKITDKAKDIDLLNKEKLEGYTANIINFYAKQISLD